MMAEEKLLMAEAAASPFGVGDDGKEDAGDAAVSDPVSAAVISSLGAKLESIDDLIARLEIEEGEVLGGVCLFVVNPGREGSKSRAILGKNRLPMDRNGYQRT